MSTPRQVPDVRRRLPPEERRRQLVAVGLQELSNRPIHALSIDRVAEIAGISRGLLFRYFPTKQDFYVAVVGAASRRMLRAATPDPDDPDPLRACLNAFVSFVDRHSDNYQAFFHGGFGADPQILEIHDEVRNTMVGRILTATRATPNPLTTMRLRGWWSMVESLAVDRTAAPDTSVDDVVDYSIIVLRAVVLDDPGVTSPGSGS
ncbi:TetR/AcrR family transcriptional regulator [Rhodococcus sp. HNM0563]|uniref:TetR family transcriptional regulator n=1 Tax=Rhodococcus sp. HNM0563 TaxID=2716339 RepID=UPI00146A2470|nr:TetR/AcrR family transcriptional regulator [Rhodococcus sp. HNM0563]